MRGSCDGPTTDLFLWGCTPTLRCARTGRPKSWGVTRCTLHSISMEKPSEIRSIAAHSRMPRPGLGWLRTRLPSAGPLLLSLLLAISGFAMVVAYARWNYTRWPLPIGDVHTLIWKSDDSLWIRTRPGLEQYASGITTWPHTFTDFFEVWLHGFDANPYSAWVLSPSIYPPLVHLVAYPVHYLPYVWAIGVFLGVSAGLWFLALRMLHASAGGPLPTLAAVALLFFALPIPLTLDRGNIELLVSLLAVISLLPAVRHRLTRTECVWPLVLAAFLKVSPVALLGMVRWRRRTLEEMIISGVICIGATLISLAMMQGSMISSGRAFFNLTRGYTVYPEETYQFRSTIWGTAQAFGDSTGLAWSPDVPSGVTSFGLVLVVALVAACLPLHLWERLAVISAGMVLFSADGPAYRLLYLLIAAAIFVGTSWYRRNWYSLLIAVLLAGVLAPKPWIPELPWAWTLLTGLCLLALFTVIFATGFRRAWRLGSSRSRSRSRMIV